MNQSTQKRAAVEDELRALQESSRATISKLQQQLSAAQDRDRLRANESRAQVAEVSHICYTSVVVLNGRSQRALSGLLQIEALQSRLQQSHTALVQAQSECIQHQATLQVAHWKNPDRCMC